MNHKTIRIELARALYDWSTSSKTTFNDDSPELSEKIKKLGIPYPNPDLAFFTTVYCELGTYNRNGAMLPKDVAEKGIDTIKFKQINFEHEGAGHVCGFILDARIVDNFIVIDGVLFKSVWKEEFDQVKKYFERGNLSVSFELWNSENGVSVLKILSDGKKIVEKLIAHGCGLLMKEKPACPKAKVFKLLAKEELVLASEQIIETVSIEDDKLSYAEQSTVEECKNCGNCPNERRNQSMAEEVIVNEFEDTEIIELAEEVQLTDEDINLSEAEEEVSEEGETEEAKKLSYKSRENLKDSDFAVVIKKGDKKIRKYPIYDAAHVRNALARLGQAAAKEGLKKLGVSVESVLKKVKSRAKKFGIETAAEEVSLPTPRPCKNCGQNLGEGQEGEYCPACVIFEQEFAKWEEVLIEAAMPAEVLKRIKELHKEGKSMKEAMKQAWKEQKEKGSTEQAHTVTVTVGEEACANCATKHDYEHMKVNYATKEQQMNDLQACYDGLKGEHANNMSECDCLKKQHEDITKKFGGKQAELEKQLQELKDKNVELEKKLEEEKQELGKKDQEIADLKVIKAKAETTKEKPSLTVGSVDNADEDRYKEIRNKVDERAFGKKAK